MRVGPCKGCVAPKRYPGCHSVCKEYIDWKAEYDKEQAAIKAQRASQPSLSSYDFDVNGFSRGSRKRR